MEKIHIRFCTLLIAIFLSTFLTGADGYNLWLRYQKVQNPELLKQYSQYCTAIHYDHESEVINAALEELKLAIPKLIEKTPTFNKGAATQKGILLKKNSEDERITEEGFRINTSKKNIIISGKTDQGILYGVYHFLRLLQSYQPINQLDITENPKIQVRILNHWDNLDRTVERGYAGFSIWNWHELPEFIDPRYKDYARANASIGINGTVVTNVNANSLVFREDYLQKAAALADVFRPYGIKLYLTARFSSPKELGRLDTADPLDPEVQQWWKKKVDEIYQFIPDFGGFLVKANSEGQPGPQEYGRNHADGANMLADALAPHGGIVMWRAFVYSDEEPVDRAKQANHEFEPLDGQFRDNVIIQVKNGPIDFQPREPFHPLFGAMPKTPLMMEFQITKEYLGQGTHLVGLSNMWEEVLDSDTYAQGEGSTVAKIIDGTLDNHKLSGMAGVANIGTSRNWTGNLFGQADWYAFGRLAWDPYMESRAIFKEWASLTFSVSSDHQETIVNLLDKSHEICVNYMTPLGLHHIMAAGHHFGPGPWVSRMSRADWTSVYYHKADSKGVGFDRTASGSNALEQYKEPIRELYSNPKTIPLKYLLWFHHVEWDEQLRTGRNLWEELCFRYNEGVNGVLEMKKQWKSLSSEIDEERFNQVLMHLNIQEKEAKWWRDACLSYFQTFSNMPIPEDYEQPEYDLQYYQSLIFPYAPGIRPRW